MVSDLPGAVGFVLAWRGAGVSNREGSPGPSKAVGGRAVSRIEEVHGCRSARSRVRARGARVRGAGARRARRRRRDPGGGDERGRVDRRASRRATPSPDRARAALVDGTLPAPLRAELLASTDPELAAARRLFRTVETDDAGQLRPRRPAALVALIAPSPPSPPSAVVAPTPDPGAATTERPPSRRPRRLAVAPTRPGAGGGGGPGVVSRGPVGAADEARPGRSRGRGQPEPGRPRDLE